MPADFRDLFIEDRESVSIRWQLGASATVRYGRRTGAGMRLRERGGGTSFHAKDGLWPERSRSAELAVLQADDGWAEDESRSAIAYVEAAARGILTEVAARSIEMDVQLFRQRVHHESPAGGADDDRSGVRIVLRAAMEGSPPVRRRLADRTAERLALRRPPSEVGIDVGTSLLRAREGCARVDGVFPAVLAAGSCGVLAHEIGHLLEVDHARASSTAPLASGRRVAGTDVSLHDDPMACDGRGAYRIDDEGMPARRRTLIESGVVVDTLSALSTPETRAGEDLGGHGRRGSYRDLPVPRMACTFLAAGPDSAAQMLADTPRGVFLRSLRAGDADPESGTMTLIIDEGFLIENGRLTRPLGEGFVVASVKELLADIDAVCMDLDFDHGAGDCVKSDQAVPVTVGMPTIRIRVARVITG